MLIGLVMLVGGFIVQGERGAVMIVTGLALGSLGGLELSIREHFGGFRSHTLLLSGAASVAVLIALAYLGSGTIPTWVALAAAVIVFTSSAWALTGVFRRRTGRAFKLR